MSELEKLTFQLEEKKDKLHKISLETFVFNPDTIKLAKEIGDLQEKIEQLKAEDNIEDE